LNRRIARIAVSAATFWIDRPYSYIVPDELRQSVVPGVRVTVPFSRGNRITEGIVLAVSDETAGEELKSVDRVLDSTPVLSDEMIKLSLWMRERYFCTVYDAVKAILPAGLWYKLSSACSIAGDFDRESAYEAAGRSERQQRVLDAVFAHGGSCDYGDVVAAFGGKDPSSAVRALTAKGVIVTEDIGRRRIKDKTTSFAILNISAEEAAGIASAKRRTAPSQAAVLEFLSGFGGASLPDIRYFTGAGAATVKRLAEDELIKIEQVEVFRRPDYKTLEKCDLPTLNEAQTQAFDGVFSLLQSDNAGAALLYGVTGSGKTSVYVRLISELLKLGKSTIMLVPEIALTPQMLQTFSSYFEDEIAVLHSSLSVGERYDEWKRIKTGRAHLVVGTRSAVFAPVTDLGMIIIDEEQEDSYKSENSPRYHAREVAKFRCAFSNSLLLLGSATPNIETAYNARIGRYGYFSLPARFNEMGLPNVMIADMKKEYRSGNVSDLSSVLVRELAVNLEHGEQSILFLNRRGMNKLISCCECGFTYRCPRCSVNLTYHSANSRLMCHYCGYSQKVDEHCPECGGALSYVGAGTQKIVEELSELFPGTEVLRMDADTVSGAGSHDVLLDRFRDEKIPIMVGTQMVTKGLNFPNVTLVGVISADQALYCGDYRASERTFSLITQVIGRSGRGDAPGRAVIQTFTPKNEVIMQAAAQDYESFYRSELELRRLQGCPPFADLFCLTAVGPVESDVLRCLDAAKHILSKRLCESTCLRILGPAPLPVVRVNNRFRYRLLVSGKDTKEIRKLLADIIIYCSKSREFKGVTLFGDINPV